MTRLLRQLSRYLTPAPALGWDTIYSGAFKAEACGRVYYVRIDRHDLNCSSREVIEVYVDWHTLTKRTGQPVEFRSVAAAKRWCERHAHRHPQ